MTVMCYGWTMTRNTRILQLVAFVKGLRVQPATKNK